MSRNNWLFLIFQLFLSENLCLTWQGLEGHAVLSFLSLRFSPCMCSSDSLLCHLILHFSLLVLFTVLSDYDVENRHRVLFFGRSRIQSLIKTEQLLTGFWMTKFNEPKFISRYNESDFLWWNVDGVFGSTDSYSLPPQFFGLIIFLRLI